MKVLKKPSMYTSQDSLLILGETTFRQNYLRFGMLPEDRLRHLWLVGKTGSGKSTLLLNLVEQDLLAGEGLALFDPHGDLADKALSLVPSSRTNQVLWFSPENQDSPVSFNIFRRGRSLHQDTSLFVSQLVAVFKKHWSDFWGPRLEHILRNAILAIASDQRATLLFLYRFLVDEDLRSKVVAQVKDPVVVRFWTQEFAGYSKSLQAEAMAPVLNKLGAFVSSPLIRNIVGIERSRLDLGKFIEQKGILLAKLPTGTIGEDAAHLLGGLLFTTIQLAAMERKTPTPPFIVYVDEFQHFVTDSVATVLSEARKFGLGLVLAHQYLGQLTTAVRDAVLGNIGSIIVFRLGGSDSQILATEFFPVFSATDLMSLECYHTVMKLTVRGETLRPFSARTLPPTIAAEGAEYRIAKIVSQSQSRFCRPRKMTETSTNKNFSKS